MSIQNRSMPMASRNATSSGSTRVSGGAGTGSAGLVAMQLLLLIAIPFALNSPDGERGLLAIAITILLFTQITLAPAIGVPLTFIYVVFMGGMRHWLFPIFGYSGFDPFLLIGPILVCLPFVSQVIQKSVPMDTLLSKLILALLIDMLLEIFNPLQGGLAVGLAGALFLIVPLLWFYLGRALATKEIVMTLLKVALFLSVVVTLYGWYQEFVGFIPSEVAFNKLAGAGAIQLVSEHTNRVYSTLSSFAEYAIFLSSCATIAFAFILKKQRIAIILWPLLILALIVSSSRGALSGSLFTAAVLWSIQGKNFRLWLPRLFVAVLLGSAGVFWSAKGFQDSPALKSNVQVSELVGHEAEGLTDPLGKKSTGSGHIAMQVSGFTAGITHPFGNGLGCTTLAAGKFGDASGVSAEGDIGNMFISLGFPGGLLMLAIMIVVVRDAGRNWYFARDLPTLAVIGILLSSMNLWLNGGQYSTVMLVWFSLGYIDRMTRDREAQDRALRRTPSSEGMATPQTRDFPSGSGTIRDRPSRSMAV